MTVPQYLDSSVYPIAYSETLNVLDAESGGIGVISAMRSVLVDTLGWTEPSANLFKTPVDAAGRFLDVLVTRISSTVWEWRVRDAAGVTVCTRRGTIFSTGGSCVRVFGSTVGVVLECPGNPNHFISSFAFAFLLDMAPNVPGDHSLYVFGGARYNTSNTDDNFSAIVGQGFCIDNGSAATQQRGQWSRTMVPAVVNYLTAAGRQYFTHLPIYINFSGTFRIAGCVPQMLKCSATLNPGDERGIWLDENNYGTFKVIGMTSVDNVRCMVRKS